MPMDFIPGLGLKISPLSDQPSMSPGDRVRFPSHRSVRLKSSSLTAQKRFASCLKYPFQGEPQFEVLLSRYPFSGFLLRLLKGNQRTPATLEGPIPCFDTRPCFGHTEPRFQSTCHARIDSNDDLCMPSKIVMCSLSNNHERQRVLEDSPLEKASHFTDCCKKGIPCKLA